MDINLRNYIIFCFFADGWADVALIVEAKKRCKLLPSESLWSFSPYLILLIGLCVLCRKNILPHHFSVQQFQNRCWSWLWQFGWQFDKFPWTWWAAITSRHMPAWWSRWHCDHPAQKSCSMAYILLPEVVCSSTGKSTKNCCIDKWGRRSPKYASTGDT